MHVGDFTYERLGGRNRQELHEVDLVRVDVEGHVRPQLEVNPLALPLGRQVIHLRQHLLI